LLVHAHLTRSGAIDLAVRLGQAEEQVSPRYLVLAAAELLIQRMGGE
jgi:hypothetical protein